MLPKAKARWVAKLVKVDLQHLAQICFFAAIDLLLAATIIQGVP